MKNKIMMLMLVFFSALSLFFTGCSDGDYKTGGGGKPQHYNVGNGQYD